MLRPKSFQPRFHAARILTRTRACSIHLTEILVDGRRRQIARHLAAFASSPRISLSLRDLGLQRPHGIPRHTQLLACSVQEPRLALLHGLLHFSALLESL